MMYVSIGHIRDIDEVIRDIVAVVVVLPRIVAHVAIVVERVSCYPSSQQLLLCVCFRLNHDNLYRVLSRRVQVRTNDAVMS